MLEVHQRVEEELLPAAAVAARGGGGGEGLDVVDDEDEGRLLEGAWY